MQVQKVTTYPVPAYPDREQVVRSPKLLLTLPQRWRRNGSACAALVSVTAMLLSACAGPGDADSASVVTTSPGSGTDETDAPMLSPTPSPTSAMDAAIAPLFTHGDGRGGFGCVSVAPPAFLSEAEAYEVIAQMAKDAGLTLQQPGPTLPKVRLPQVTLFPDSKNAVVGTKSGQLELDGVDSNGKTAFEFVSTIDLVNWQKNKNEVGPSVTSYDFASTAAALRDGLQQAKPSIAVGVFYDPSYTYNDEIRKIIDENGYEDAAVQKIKEIVKADLREQVKDFLAWLKAQGIV